MKKTKIPVCGMHCKSCEILLEKSIKKLDNIKSVKADEKTGTIEVEFTGDGLEIENISRIINECGYTIGEKKKTSWIADDMKVYSDFAISLFLILALYILISALGFDTSKLLNISTPTVGVAFFVGLTAGISSCMALVGGLVLGVSAKWSEDHTKLTRLKKFEPHIFFNIGRIVGFGILGGILGLFGSIFTLSPFAIGSITIITGIVMLLLGINLSEVSPKLSGLTLTLPKSLGGNIGNDNGGSKHIFALTTGALTFFLPCGFTLAMQAYAVSTGSFMSGAMVMSFFALGTAPGLLGIGGLSSFFKGDSSKIFFRFTGFAIILLSIFNISNGTNLIGLGGLKLIGQPTDTTNLEVQEIKMVQSEDGYTPSEIHIKPNTKIRWHLEGTNPYSCSSQIVVPSLGVKKNLEKGDNLIEFVSPKDGEIKFSCSMGMYSGKLIIDPNLSGSISPIDNAKAATVESQSQPKNSGGGCSMMRGNSPNTAPVQNDTKGNQTESGIDGNISATYLTSGMQPQTFNLKEGKTYILTIDVKDTIEGCMSQIVIPGFDENIQDLVVGNKVKFTIKADKKGKFPITCAMGVPHGFININ